MSFLPGGLHAPVQRVLGSAAGRHMLESWPQYQRAIVNDASGKPHMHLGVLQYFLAWFAFYVIKGGDGGSGGSTYGSQLRQGAGMGLSVRKAADALHLTRGAAATEDMRHPYLALLRQFLVQLVPRPAAAAQPATALAKGEQMWMEAGKWSLGVPA
jgi:hypothetical protein